MRGLTIKRHEVNFGQVTEICYFWIVVVVIKRYMFVKIHRTVHQKQVNFTVCKFYLNTPVFLKVFLKSYLFYYLFGCTSS